MNFQNNPPRPMYDRNPPLFSGSGRTSGIVFAVASKTAAPFEPSSGIAAGSAEIRLSTSEASSVVS